MKQTLYLLLGYPGSGKSTFAKQLATEIGAVRLNPDELRRVMFTDITDIRNPKNNPFIFGALDYATRQILAAGQSVIYDANNNRIRDRQKDEKIAREFSVPAVILWIKTPLETAKAREAQRSAAKETINIPAARYQQLVAALQEPLKNEPCITIDGLQPFDQQLESFKLQRAELEEKS